MTKKLNKTVTPSSEPVNVAQAMSPHTTGSSAVGGATELASLPTVMGSENNVFRVVGSFPNGLRTSFRLWKESSATGVTRLGFRVRVGDRIVNGVSIPATVSDFEAIAPKDVWTSKWDQTTQHRSITGYIKVHANPWEVSTVKHLVSDMNIPAVIYSTMVSTLGPGGWVDLIDMDTFKALVLWDIQRVLGDIPKPNYDDPPSLTWGAGGENLLEPTATKPEPKKADYTALGL